jgi:predicted RNA binding protein YcfA (HicA-like mRNA interferase family)
MAKLPQVKSKEAIKALEHAGFVIQRIKSGHYILKKENLRVIVPTTCAS